MAPAAAPPNRTPEHFIGDRRRSAHRRKSVNLCASTLQLSRSRRSGRRRRRWRSADMHIIFTLVCANAGAAFACAEYTILISSQSRPRAERKAERLGYKADKTIASGRRANSNSYYYQAGSALPLHFDNAHNIYKHIRAHKFLISGSPPAARTGSQTPLSSASSAMPTKRSRIIRSFA